MSSILVKKMQMKKPDGFWQCRACLTEWRGNQLYLDQSVMAIRWTCGNLECGGVCDKLKPVNEMVESWDWNQPPGFAKNRNRRPGGRTGEL